MSRRPAPRVEVHIQELLLEGFPRAERYRIAEAVERELAHMFAGDAVPRSLRRPASIERLDAGSFQRKAGVNGPAVGAEIAKAVYRGLGGKVKA